MNDIITYFERTIEYLEGVLAKSQLENQFTEKLDEQKENLNDFSSLLNQYAKEIETFKTYENIDSNETLNKLMTIHKFITNLEWHISEISGLKNEVIKISSSKREK